MFELDKENPKEDGSSYNLYLDGLRVLQLLTHVAELCSSCHITHEKSSKRNFNQNRTNKTKAPFLDITDAEIEKLLI